MKKVTEIILIILLSMQSFAAVVSDNDGSAFITKAEFDSLKNDFQTQIDNYNVNIDNVIDVAIASYLSGLKISKEERINPFYPVYPTKIESEYNINIFSVPNGKLKKNKQYRNKIDVLASKFNARGTWGSTVTSLDPYKYNNDYGSAGAAWYFATATLKSEEIEKQRVFVTSKEQSNRIIYSYENGYTALTGGMFWKQLWIGTQQSWWIDSGIVNNKKLEEPITTWNIQGFNSNGFNNYYSESVRITKDERYDQGTRGENDLRYLSGMYGNPGGCGLIVTKIEDDLDENIYLFNTVDDEVVIYNELDEEIEEYEEEKYSSETMTKRQAVKSETSDNLATWRSDEAGYGWFLDTAWPHFRIKQTHSGKSGSTFIRLKKLSEVENGLLVYMKPNETSYSAPGYAGGLPLFTMKKDGDMKFSVKIASSSDLEPMTKARIWVYDGEFPNKLVSDFTAAEKTKLVKFDTQNYIDIDTNIDKETTINLKDLKKDKTYFLKFGDKDLEYGGQITYLDDFIVTYKD